MLEDYPEALKKMELEGRQRYCISLKNHRHGDDKILKWVEGVCSI
jgi:hypothetical protein